MRSGKKTGCAMRLAAHLSVLLCALALGALFYGAMVYQLAGEDAYDAPAQTQPMRLLALGEGTLTDERTQQMDAGGVRLTVVTREYRLEGGMSALAISASDAVYVERLAREGWQPQRITGFPLAGLSAVYERREQRALLAARDGDALYMIETDAPAQTLYALGSGALLE